MKVAINICLKIKNNFNIISQYREYLSVEYNNFIIKHDTLSGTTECKSLH